MKKISFLRTKRLFFVVVAKVLKDFVAKELKRVLVRYYERELGDY
jgi:hypothetical protein